MNAKNFSIHILPLLVAALSIAGITAILYYTMRPTEPPLTVKEVSLVTRNVSPVEQKAAAARIAALHCPDYYSDAEQWQIMYPDFIKDYGTAYPSAYGEKDFLTGQVDFLISHHCTSALMKLGYDGKSPITPQIRQELIDDALN